MFKKTVFWALFFGVTFSLTLPAAENPFVVFPGLYEHVAKPDFAARRDAAFLSALESAESNEPVKSQLLENYAKLLDPTKLRAAANEYERLRNADEEASRWAKANTKFNNGEIDLFLAMRAVRRDELKNAQQAQKVRGEGRRVNPDTLLNAKIVDLAIHRESDVHELTRRIAIARADEVLGKNPSFTELREYLEFVAGVYPPHFPLGARVPIPLVRLSSKIPNENVRNVWNKALSTLKPGDPALNDSSFGELMQRYFENVNSDANPEQFAKELEQMEGRYRSLFPNGNFLEVLAAQPWNGNTRFMQGMEVEKALEFIKKRREFLASKSQLDAAARTQLSDSLDDLRAQTKKDGSVPNAQINKALGALERDLANEGTTQKPGLVTSCFLVVKRLLSVKRP